MDQIKNWLPIGSIAVIVFSFLNLHFYFTQFGVVIHHSIDVSEIIFSLTGFFASFLFLLIATTWHFLFVDHKKQTAENSHEETKTYTYLKFHRIRFLRKFAGVFSKMTLYVFFGTIGIGFYIFYLNTQYSDTDLMKSSVT